MKTKFFYSIILSLGLIFAGSTVNNINGQSNSTNITKKTITKTTTKPVVKKYTCPEHPDVVMAKPGKCPKCGMALVEKKEMKKVMNKDMKMGDKKEVKKETTKVVKKTGTKTEIKKEVKKTEMK